MRRILVCDMSNGENVTRVLRCHGHEVTQCEDSKHAIECLRAEAWTFDVVIAGLDFGNGDGRGCEFIREVNDVRNSRGYLDKPAVLCLSSRRDPRLRLNVERLNARFAIASPTDEWLTDLEMLFYETDVLRQNGPHFRLVHLYSPKPGALCFPEEQVVALTLIVGRRELQALAGRPLLVTDFLARYAYRYPLTANQILAGMTAGAAFYSAKAGIERLTERAIITNIMRARHDLDVVLQRAGLPVKGADVIVSQEYADRAARLNPRPLHRFCLSRVRSALSNSDLLAESRKHETRSSRAYWFRGTVEIVHPDATSLFQAGA